MVVLGHPVVFLIVVFRVSHPVWQVGQTGGVVTVMVGVTGHAGLAQGTSVKTGTCKMQSGCGGQVVSRGQLTVSCY